MEPRGDSQTDILNVRTPSPVTSEAGSDCTISKKKTAEAAAKKRDDVRLGLMGHSIPGSTIRDEDLVSETNSSIGSTPSALKLRLKNLPPPIEAVKLATVNLHFRRERDLYLHLQSLTNRIEENDEPEITVSTTDSSRTVIDSESNLRRQGQDSRARARRRERLNSSFAMSQHRQSSDLYLCSSGLSSPEPLSLREIREYFRGEVSQGQNSDNEDTQSKKESISIPIPTKFGGYRPTSGLIFRNLSSGSESEAASERIGRKKSRGEDCQRNGISALEIEDAEEDFVSSESFRNPDRIMQVEPFSVEEIEDLEARLMSPVPFTDSRVSFGGFNLSQRLRTCSELRVPRETAWELMSPGEKNRYLDSKIGSEGEENTLMDSPIRHFDNGEVMETDFTDSVSKIEDPTFNISLEPSSGSHINLQTAEAEDLVIQNVDGDCESALPNIPPLQIDYSQSQSLSSEAIVGTNRSSLDVSALIQALSDVSIRQEKNTTYRTNRSMPKLKSPLGYGNRFSESSGPRSSEYTPAAGGSRQSLTSQDVSETHSVRNCKGEARSRVIAELDERSARLSSRSPGTKLVENDSGFIPVAAVVETTDLARPKHSSRVKSIGKLISPKKYPNTEFGEKIVESLTSRTDVSQSSEGCQRSFRSLKSVPVMSKAPGNRINNPSQPGTVSGRRILEPLNTVPKIQPDLLTKVNRKMNLRRDSPEIVSSQPGSGKTTCSSRRSHSSQCNSVDLPNHRFTKRLNSATIQPKKSPDARSESLVHHTEISRSSRTPGEAFNNISRPTTERDHELLERSLQPGKSSCASSARSSLTSGNTLYLRSEGHSMSSGDYEGRTNWSSPSRNDDLTEDDDTYDPEDEQPEGGANCKMTSQGIESARSPGNCVYLVDLQDGREVTLPCRDAHPEDVVGERKLFEHLPNEISASLTRHGTLGAQVTENIQSSEEMITFEDLKKNIQQTNDHWIKNFKSDDDLRHPLAKNTSDFSPDDKLVSSASSPVRFRNSRNQSRYFVRNQTKIPLKIPSINHRTIVEPTGNSRVRSSASSRIDPDSSACSSPLYRHSQQGADCSSKSAQLDSQRSLLMHSGSNSHRNTTVFEFVETLDQTISRKRSSCKIAEHCTSESGSLRKEVISGSVAEISHKVPVSLAPTDETRNTDEHDEPVLNSPSAEVISVPNPDAKAEERSRVSNVHNSKCDSALECREWEEAEKSHIPGKDHDKDEERSIIATSDQDNSFASRLKDEASKNSSDDSNLEIQRDNGFGVCGTNRSSNSSKSSKSHTLRKETEDAVISSPVKTVLSVSKANTSADSKWDLPIMQSGVNSLRKSQDRFPFTISESASRKASMYKVAADVGLGQMMEEKNTNVESNDAQQLILENVDDREPETSDMIDTKPKIQSCSLTPFLEELTNKISNDFPQSWTTEIPSIGPNFISYGCRPEPRTLMPTMKGIVKKFSAKLRYSRAKRRRDPEETNVEILYRNKKCRFESGEGSSSAASLYQSQFLTTNDKLVKGSTDGSRASSANAVKPKRNHDCINVSIEQKTGRGCDHNDMWIQEFDSDAEFDGQDATVRSGSPRDDRYSIFLAKRKFPGTDRNDRPNVREGGDNERVTSTGEYSGNPSSRMQSLVSKSPKPPPNSTNEFMVQTLDDDSDDPTVNTGCCCFRMYHLFATSKRQGSKKHRRTEV